MRLRMGKVQAPGEEPVMLLAMTCFLALAAVLGPQWGWTAWVGAVLVLLSTVVLRPESWPHSPVAA